jgi:hypothetical protein
LLLSEASGALRHAFLGERQVARIPGLPRDLPLRSIEALASSAAAPWAPASPSPC